MSSTATLVKKVLRRPISISKIILEAVYQLARNEHSRYHRYRALKLDAPPKLPPSQRRMLSPENSR